jgi:hypothetical protein
MEDKHLFNLLEKLVAEAARIATALEQRLDLERQKMIDDALMQKVLDMGIILLDKESSDQAAIAAKDATIADLTSQTAPNPALVASATDFLNKALEANPPAADVPPVDVPAAG